MLFITKNVILNLVIKMNSEKINLRKWMENIDGNRDLLSLNSVGTHDCVTQYVQLSHLARCQDRNIYEQLCLGVRGLDIRVKSKGDRLKMVHAFTKAFVKPSHFSAWMDMEDVLKHCYHFLDENPSETIVFQFKNDSGKEMEKCFDILYNTYIKADEDRWYLENRVPDLCECRGKIVLIRRCKMADREEYNDRNSGIDFSKWVEQDTAVPEPLILKTSGENEVTFIVQDRYKYKPVPRWNDCIKPFLDTMKPFDGTYIINYLSTAGGYKGPYNNSRYINPHFMAYPLDSENYYGMIYVDFPTPELTEKIIRTNF